jgi:hypothetical protein
VAAAAGDIDAGAAAAAAACVAAANAIARSLGALPANADSIANALPAHSMRQRVAAELDAVAGPAAVAAATHVRKAARAAAKTLERSLPAFIAAALRGEADGAFAVLEWALALPPLMNEPQRSAAGAAMQTAANRAYCDAVSRCGGPAVI